MMSPHINTETFAFVRCEQPSSDSTVQYRVECIEGVEYWFRFRGDAAVMSPRIDSETLTFISCEGAQR